MLIPKALARHTLAYIKGFFLLLAFCLYGGNISAQTAPANDNFRNAEKITITNGGYGLGTFQSSKTDLTKATKEAGESIHLLQYFAGTDKKTVWFVFETQTPRNVTIALRQRDTLIAQDAVGITVYRSKSATQPPNLGELEASLTPISKFGSTGNTCLTPDKYYVQVSAKANANAEIWLNIVVDNASPAPYDLPKDAYEFGILRGSNPLIFDIGCQGIDNKNEFMAALGPDYNQTAWLTFKTDNYSDIIAFTFFIDQRLRFADTVQMGYRLYKGDAKNAFSKLKLKDSAIFKHACNPLYPQYCGQVGMRRYICDLQPDTIYSIQLIFHKQAQYNLNINADERGERLAASSNPKKLPADYQLGVLKSGFPVSFSDYFACNSQMSANLCGTVNVPQVIDTISYGSVIYRIDTFDLSLWATFEIPAGKGHVTIRSDVKTCNNYYDYQGRMFRLFKGDVTKSCNLPLFQQFWASGGISQDLCLEPGVYSYQVLGTKTRLPVSRVCDEIDLGKEVITNIRYYNEVPQTQAIHYKPSNPEDLGDITPKLATSVTSQPDYFGMTDDTVTIDGVKFSNRFHFRQFYISKPTYLTIKAEEVSGFSSSHLYLFQGRVSKGIDSLKRITDSVYGTSWFTQGYPFRSSCTPLPAGWYTVFSGLGVNCTTDRKYADKITISSYEVCKRKFNRPYKASYAGDLDWNKTPPQPGATAKEYTFEEECFGCQTDTPFSKLPLDVCKRPYYYKPFTRVAYYVFNVKQASYLKVSTVQYDADGRNVGSTYFQLYKGDVRIDSLKYKDAGLLLTPCSYAGDFCNVQPGKYTLVALGNNSYIVQPKIIVEKAGISAYDHAINAADLGYIPPTNTEKMSANDLFYCTTGTQYTDPDTTTNYFYTIGKIKTSIPYPVPPNMVMNDNATNYYNKNLWYTFTCAGTGDITVNIYPKTPGDEHAIFRTRIYRSDENGAATFSQLRANGRIDSTNKQGLVAVAGNYYFNNELNNTNTITFQKKGCDTARYYIIVERYGSYYKELNNLLSVGVKYNNVRFDGRNADLCSNAEEIELNAPGEKGVSSLINCHTRGESYGEDGSNMACLVRDTLPYKTTWFKFRYTGTQRVDISFRIEENTTAHHSQIHYRILYGTCNAMSPGPCVENSLSYFKLDCMGPGDYYIQVVSPDEATGNITLYAKAELTTYPVCKPIDLLNPQANFSFTGGCNNTPVQFINLSSAGKDISYAWKLGNATTSTAKNPVVQYKPTQFADTFLVTLRVTNNITSKYDEISIPVVVFKDKVTLKIAKKNIYINCGEKPMLEASSNYAYATFEWNPKEGLDNPYSATPVFTSGNSDATYTVTMHAESCELTDTVHIYLRPKMPISGDTVLCTGSKGVLNAMPGFNTYYWSVGKSTQSIVIDTPGKYWVYGYMNNGCRAGDTIIVKSGNNLVVDLGKDTTVCPGESVVLKPVTSAANYLWSTGETSQQITVNKPGKYWLKMDNGQCIGSDTITVFNNPLPAVNLKDTLLLCGDNAVWVDIYKPGQKYLWSNGSKAGQLFISEPGKYYVQIEQNGCVSKDSVEIKQMQMPPLDLGKDTFLCGDFNILLDAGEWKSYEWKPNNSTQRELRVNEYGRYIVKVFTEEGCETSDTINILQECDPQLWVPNVFTPYNDDINNTFKAVGHDIATFEMKIYNRWGELLYVTNDINKGWDGVFKGVLSQMDVYLWTITYTGYHTNKYIYGTVTLLR